MAVVWVGSEPWVGSFPWAQTHPTSDRDGYLDSVLTGALSTATLTGGPVLTAALAGDGTSLADLTPYPLLTAVLIFD